MKLKKLLTAVSISYVLLMFANLLGYLSRVFFARVFTTTEYGMFYSIIGFFAFFTIFRSLGFDSSLVHFTSKYVKEKTWKRFKYAVKYVFKFQMILGLIFAAVFFILSRQVAIHFFHSADVTVLLRIHAITFFVIGFARFFDMVFKGLQNYVVSALYDGARLMFVMIVSVVLWKFDMLNVKTLLIVWLGGYLFLILVYQLFFIPYYKKFWSTENKSFVGVKSELRKYAIPLMLGVGAEIILSKSDVLILTFFKDFSQVALYEIAFPSSRILLLFGSSFVLFLFPMVSKLHFDKSSNTIKDILSFIYNSGLFMIAPLMIILVSYPDIIIRLIFSEKYLAASTAIQIFTIGVFFLVFAQVNFNVLAGIGEIKKKTQILYGVAIFNVIFDILLIPSLGFLGAVIVTSVSYFFMWLLSYFLCVKKIPNFRLKVFPVVKILICSGAFILSMFLLKHFITGINVFAEAIIVAVVSFGVYGILGLILRVVDIKKAMQMYRAAVRQKG